MACSALTRKALFIYYLWRNRRCPRHAVVRARAPLLPLLHASADFPALHASGAVLASSRLFCHRNPQLACSHAKL